MAAQEIRPIRNFNDRFSVDFRTKSPEQKAYEDSLAQGLEVESDVPLAAPASVEHLQEGAIPNPTLQPETEQDIVANMGREQLVDSEALRKRVEASRLQASETVASVVKENPTPSQPSPSLPPLPDSSSKTSRGRDTPTARG